MFDSVFKDFMKDVLLLKRWEGDSECQEDIIIKIKKNNNKKKNKMMRMIGKMKVVR